MTTNPSLPLVLRDAPQWHPLTPLLLNEAVVRSFVQTFSDNNTYRDYFTALWNFRAAVEDLFIYSTSPLKGQKEHPLYKAMFVANELIGILLAGRSADTMMRS